MKRSLRTIERIRANPGSIRVATVAVTSVTVSVVVLGAVLMRVFDPGDYPTFGRALWFTLQTVTTVGYGDATPESALGRFVASIVMVTAIGLITVVTASITSVFVEAARSNRIRLEHDGDADSADRLETSLGAIIERLDRIESMLGAPPDPDDHDNADADART